jgi:hypothetical protein
LSQPPSDNNGANPSDVISALQRENQSMQMMLTSRGQVLFGEMLNAIEIRSAQAVRGDMQARREILALVKALDSLKAAGHGIATG